MQPETMAWFEKQGVDLANHETWMWQEVRDTLLCKAVRTASLEVVEWLLSMGANPNARSGGHRALHLVALCWHDNAERKKEKAAIARQLILAGADVAHLVKVKGKDCWGLTPLELAVNSDAEELVAVLVNAGAKNNKNTALKDAVNQNSLGLVRLLMPVVTQQAKMIAFRHAVKRQCLSIINFFMDSGIDINAADLYGNTVVHLAATCSNTASLELLLAHQAKVNVQNRNGQTPLHLAAKKANKSFNLLIQSGSNPILRDKKGDAAIHYLADAKLSDAIVRERAVLLKEKGCINQIDAGGNTALHRSVRHSVHRGFVFVEAGVKVNYRNVLGMTALFEYLKKKMEDTPYFSNFLSCMDVEVVQKFKDYGAIFSQREIEVFSLSLRLYNKVVSALLNSMLEISEAAPQRVCFSGAVKKEAVPGFMEDRMSVKKTMGLN